MSEKPTIAQKGPYPVEVVGAETYYCCTCGKSKTQPFCDGSHAGTSFTPVAYTPDTSGTVYFCGCKQSNSMPLCDGTHNDL